MEDIERGIFAQEVAKWITILDAMFILSIAWKKASSQSNIVEPKLLFWPKNQMKRERLMMTWSLLTGLTQKQFENWLPVDDGAVVAPEIITEEEKLDKIWYLAMWEGNRRWRWQFQHWCWWKSSGTFKPAEITHYLTWLESDLESFDFSDISLFRTLKENINVEFAKCPAKQTTLNKVFIKSPCL